MQTGSYGAGTAGQRQAGSNPFGTTGGIGSILTDLLSGGAGNIGGSIAQLISQQNERDVQGLRSRFGAGGGTAFGTPAAYGEALLRSETAPKLTQAIGGLQTNLLGMLLPLYAGLASKGIPQAETVLQPNALTQGLQLALPLLGTLFGAGANPFGAAAGGAGLGAGGGGLSPTPPFNPNAIFQVPSSLDLGKTLYGGPAASGGFGGFGGFRNTDFSGAPRQQTPWWWMN